MNANGVIGGDIGARPAPRRVLSRLKRVFVLQLALIAATTALGVLAAGFIAEQVLVNRALVGEAEYFWKHRARDADFPLPDTLNLQSWISSREPAEIPPVLATLPLGQERLVVDGDERIVHVSERGDERLYLLFQSQTVTRLAFWFGLVPLIFVLLVMYGFAAMTYSMSRRAVSPFTRLAAAIETFDFAARDAAELDLGKLRDAPDAETRVLVDALGHFIARSQRSLERERDFTRYASHELRTPLAVISGSISTLELAPLQGAPARAVDRIRRSTRHMSDLLAALLLLARDTRAVDCDQATDVGELVEHLVGELDGIARRSGHASEVPIVVERSSALHVRASDAPLTIVLGNLLRNARTYTDAGRVVVRVEADAVAVMDTGPGLDAEERHRVFEPFYRGESATPLDGHTTTPERAEGLGLGLAIAKKTCENQGWILSVESVPGEGSTFRVAFGETRVDQTPQSR